MPVGAVLRLLDSNGEAMKTITLTDEQEYDARRLFETAIDDSETDTEWARFRSLLALLADPARSPQPAMSREEGIEACARAGIRALGIGPDGLTFPAFCHIIETRTPSILAGESDSHDAAPEFAAAVIAKARHLVATGQCPALADCKALRT